METAQYGLERVMAGVRRHRALEGAPAFLIKLEERVQGDIVQCKHTAADNLLAKLTRAARCMDGKLVVSLPTINAHVYMEIVR